MKLLALILALLSITAFGCKHQYWTMVSSEEGETVAVVDQPENTEPEIKQPEPEPEPDVEPPTPKQIIFILGIDGMD